MSFKDRLNADLKDAMRKKDAVRRTVIRTLLSEIRNAEIAAQKDLPEDDIQGVMSKQAQQRRDSIEAYDSAGRQDLVDKETAELSIISVYLPERMTEDEVAAIIAEPEKGGSPPSPAHLQINSSCFWLCISPPPLQTPPPPV